tara:strand:- start:8491 stop:9492 length:1002 start_codon:yes stop_codon:yes gene_type:complete
MGSLYGYQAANHEGTAYNSRIQSYNQGVLLSNQINQDNYKTSSAIQERNRTDDTTDAKESKALFGFTDGKGALSQVSNANELISGIKKAGFIGYAKGATADRLNSIKTTTDAIIAGRKPPPPTSTVKATGRTLGDDPAGFTAEKFRAARAAPAPAEAAIGGLAEGEKATEIESSGVGTRLLKKGITAAIGEKTASAVGDAGLTAVSEIGGKAIGDFSGVGDLAESTKDLFEGKGFFHGDSTGDKYAEAGAAFDLVGTAFPPAELVGGALNMVSAIFQTKDALKTIKTKKTQDGKVIVPPKPQQIKVSPTFSSLGLVASAPISAKQSIVGSSTF